MKNFTHTFLLLFALFSFGVAQGQFKFENTGTTQTLWDLHHAPDGNIYAAGNNGFLMRAQAQCGNWEVLSTPVSNGLRKVRFVNSNIGFACGTSGTLLRTLDGGTTWQSMTTGTSSGLLAMEFINDSTGFIAGGGSGGNLILKTTDTGSSWTPVAQNLPWSPFDMHFVNQNIGYMSGVLGVIYKTVDGGNSWTDISAGVGPGNPVWTGIYFTSADTGYVAGQNGSISKTTDGGTTWTPQTTPGSDYLNTIFFTQAQQGYAAGNSGAIYKTNDGQNWSRIATPFTTALRGILELNNEIMLAGSSGLVVSYMPGITYDILFSETFCDTASADSLRNWTNTGTTSWRFDNPGNRSVLDSLLDAPFAVLDAEFFGSSAPDSAVLESDFIDISGEDTLALLWNEFYRPDSSGNSTCRIEIIDGTTQHTIYENSGGYNGQSYVDYISPVNQTPQSAQLPFGLSQSQIKIRVTYINTSAQKNGWWAIDNMQLSNGFKDKSIGSAGSGQNFCSATDSSQIEITINNTGNIDIPGAEIAYGFPNRPLAYYFLDESISAGTSKSFFVSADTVIPQNTSTVLQVQLVRAFDGNPANNNGQYNISAFSPVADLGNDTALCSNQSHMLESANTLYDSAFWTINNDTIGTGNQLTIDSAGIYTITKFLAGCIDSDTIKMSIVKPAKVSIPSDTVVCGFDFIELNLNMSDFDSLVRTPAAATGNSALIETSGLYVFKSYDRGCKQTDSLYIDLVNETVGLPEEVILCEGEDTLISPNNLSGENYLWLHNNTETPEVRLSDSGSYILQMTARGCEFFDTLLLRRQEIPTGMVTTSTPEIRAGENVTFEINTNVDSVLWIFGGNANISNARGIGPHSVVFTSSGIETVEWQLQNEACGVITYDSAITVLDPVFVGNKIINTDVKLFPNPAVGHVTIKTEHNADVSFFNISGSLVKKSRMNSGANQIDISEFTPGIYLVIIEGSNNREVLKLVVG